MKRDVEGSESDVFAGTARILASDPPVVIFEHNPFAARETGRSTVTAWQLLRGLGYKMFRLTSEGTQRMPVIPPEAVVNVLGLPSEHPLARCQ